MADKKIDGRPAGKRKTAKIEVVIEPEVKDAFMKVLYSEGRTASVEICRWIREYLSDVRREREDGIA